jgi:SAM-dependent methyltransferase
MSQADICIFIDDDNEVEPGAVAELEKAFDDPDVGLAGPVIYAGDSGTIWCGGISRSPWTGQTRCILGGESTLPPNAFWHTDDMPNAFGIPRDTLEKIGGFDEERFPIHYEEADITARIRELGFRSIVVRDARVRHYGWVGLSPGSAMVRAIVNHGDERARQMVLSRVRFHFIHSSGLQKCSAVGIFLPIWGVLTSLGCLRADESWGVRLTTARAVIAGMISGYRESLRDQTKRRTSRDMSEMKEPELADSNGFISTIVPLARTVSANALKTFAFHSGLHRVLFYRYDYMFRPRELSLLVTSLTETSGLSGPILEIGCAAGHTTVYLNKHLDDLKDSRVYVCLDTFAGFTKDDIAVEVDRGHGSNRYAHLFRAYRKEWFDQTMANNHVERVSSIQADVNAFDFSPYEDISFCLVDVDLMRPVQNSLQEVFPRMAPGGIILVDDCRPNAKYDGALAAYLEFVGAHNLPVDIREDKVGVIKVPAARLSSFR